jgi:5-methylthioadenosine/S-adenosylhomocysteine deaminase
MCRICDEARSGFVRAAPETSGLMGARSATHQAVPRNSGLPGHRLLLRGGHVLSIDPAVGDFAAADVMISGYTIEAVAPNLEPGDAEIVDVTGMIVMPGFVDTHHHQFETALRSFLADAILVNDGKPHGAVNCYDYVLQKFSLVSGRCHQEQGRRARLQTHRLQFGCAAPAPTLAVRATCWVFRHAPVVISDCGTQRIAASAQRA